MLSGRMKAKEGIMYMVFQVMGALIGSTIIWILTSNIDMNYATTTGANACAPGVSLIGGLIAEVIFSFVFVLVVLGTTDAKKGAGNLAGLAIGLSLILVHIVCIPITGTSVNPARSIAPALFQGGEDYLNYDICHCAVCRSCFGGRRMEKCRKQQIIEE